MANLNHLCFCVALVIMLGGYALYAVMNGKAKLIQELVKKTGCKQCYLERIKEHCPNNKTIYQYSLDGTFIKEWRSISYAGRELHINISNISMCANGKRPNAGGFKWSYDVLGVTKPQ